MLGKKKIDWYTTSKPDSSIYILYSHTLLWCQGTPCVQSSLHYIWMLFSGVLFYGWWLSNSYILSLGTVEPTLRMYKSGTGRNILALCNWLTHSQDNWQWSISFVLCRLDWSYLLQQVVEYFFCGKQSTVNLQAVLLVQWTVFCETVAISIDLWW